MAYKYKDNYVSCPDGCRNCGRKNQLVEVCDICENDTPVYNDSGTVICEDCIESYVENYWDEISLSDKLDLLDIKKVFVKNIRIGMITMWIKIKIWFQRLKDFLKYQR